eukprot:scaffold385_cov305-Pinguiococcus_pyrenoidosus.AAC.24
MKKKGSLLRVSPPLAQLLGRSPIGRARIEDVCLELRGVDVRVGRPGAHDVLLMKACIPLVVESLPGPLKGTAKQQSVRR